MPKLNSQALSIQNSTKLSSNASNSARGLYDTPEPFTQLGIKGGESGPLVG